MKFGSGLMKYVRGDASATPGARVAPSPTAAALNTRYKRVPSERRVKEELIVFNDYGLMRHATRYTACEWDPIPWSLVAWTNEKEDAEQFSLALDSGIGPDDLIVEINISPDGSKSKDSIRRGDCQPNYDDRFRNRLIHYYRSWESEAIFLIDLCFLKEEITFFHAPRKDDGKSSRRLLGVLPQSTTDVVPLMLPTTAAAPKSGPAANANPFAERVDRIVRLHEQYETAKSALLARNLPKQIAEAALDELEREFQDRIAALDGYTNAVP